MEELEIAQRLAEHRRYNAREYLFQDEGELRRELYPKHLEFFEKGSEYRIRACMAANRVGKTLMGTYEVMCHATGWYPKWWKGKRFDRAVKIWVAGDTGKTTRDIIQGKLLGAGIDYGSGMIPLKCLGKTMQKVGVPDAVEIAYVKHSSGGQSVITFKSYDQRREGFQGTEQDVILLDEEPPLDVFTECILRTMTTQGIVMLTWTPLLGLSETVMSFIPKGEIPESGVCGGGRYIMGITWDDCPHLTKKDIDELMESIPIFQRDARSKGIPQLGSGAIYQVPESEILVDDFEIPEHWPRAYGMDVGWNRTAVVWGAKNPDDDVIYLYAEHYRGQAEPIVHVESIKARGKWIKGVIDPASRGRGQKDGISLLDMYLNMGLQLNIANNAVEAGIYEVWERLSAGKLKIFKSLSNLRSEYRIYRRDEKGQIVKKNDHLLDALRYLIMSGFDFGVAKKEKLDRYGEFGYTVGINNKKFGEVGWMQ